MGLVGALGKSPCLIRRFYETQRDVGQLLCPLRASAAILAFLLPTAGKSGKTLLSLPRDVSTSLPWDSLEQGEEAGSAEVPTAACVFGLLVPGALMEACDSNPSHEFCASGL